MYGDFFNDNIKHISHDFFLDEMCNLGSKKHIPKKTQIYHYDEYDVFIVINGFVKVSILTESGIEKTLYYLTKGDVHGESLFFSKDKYNYIITTVTDSYICFIKNSSLEKFIFTNPSASNYLINSLVLKYRLLLLQMEDLLTSSPLTMISSTLYRLSVEFSEKVDGITQSNISIPLTHQDIANLAGCSRITATRTLTRLKNMGVIDCCNKNIIILDESQLKDLSSHKHK